MDTLFSNVTIVTMDEAMHVYFDAYLGVTDGKISYLAREAPKEKTKRLVPGEGMVLMPGLINCHTHLPMSVLRGYADDVELSSWLNDYIFPHEDRLDGRSAKAAALLSIAECVRFGTTSISDMYNFCDEIAEAVAESGIKANIARGATLFGEDFDFETHPACRELVALKEKWDGYDNGRIRVEASVHGEYTSDYRLWDALSGVIWVLIVFHPFMELVNWVVDTFFQSNNPEVAISYKLSAFHSIFNICNVCILIWAVKLIERTVCALIHPKEEDEEPRLRFITGGMLSTAELSILQARKEIHLFAERTHRMFGMVQDLLHTEKDDDFNKLFSRIEKYENISDNMELEIANYLNQVSEGRLSSESKLQIRAMLREVTEIESIGDSCYNLARTINRKRQTNLDFTEKQYEHIHFMMKLTNDALAQMIVVVEKPEHQSIDINKSFNLENEINNYRNQLKNQNILDVNNKEYDYQMGVYYMDIIAECEKLGDYVVNVVEASSDVKEKKAS